MDAGIPAPTGDRWRARFHSDGSETTGSTANHLRPFVVLRRCTEDEADPGEDGEIPLWIIRFTDGAQEQFTAWSDEVLVGHRADPMYRPEDRAITEAE